VVFGVLSVKTWRSIELDGFLYWIIEDGSVINRRPADWDV
jgi:hypothetical protein